MKPFRVKVVSCLGFSALALGVGWLAGRLTRPGLEAVYPLLHKPPFTPPGAVFPLVWGALYLLLGVGMGLAASRGLRAAAPSLVLWTLQLAVNFGWAVLFFGLDARGAALGCLAVLWLLALDMTLAMARVSAAAALLQLPYLLWLTFAAYLNAGVWLLNR